MSEITFFWSLTAQPQHVKLAQFCKGIMEPESFYAPEDAKSLRQRIERIRNEADPDKRKKLKTGLPFVKISGTFNGLKEADMINHSGYIAVDIDKIGTDAPALRDELMNIEYVLFSALSVSGKGVFAIIQLGYPDKHRAQFETLQHNFSKLGLQIDSSCSDPSRNRFISIDPDAKYQKGKKYTFLPVPKPKPKKANKTKTSLPTNDKDVFDRALAYCNERGYHFAEGNRHNSILVLAGYLNYFGVPQHETEQFVENNLGIKITTNCVSWIYKNEKSKFGEGVQRYQSKAQPVPKPIFRSKQPPAYPPDWDEVQPYPTDHPDYTLMLRHEAESIE